MPRKLTKKWFAIAALGFALPALNCIAQAPWTLITPDENGRDSAAPHVPAPPDTPPPPRIDLVRPDISKPLQNPVSIEVRFTAGTGKEIDMQSFRAAYGWLGIDVTNRLLQRAVKGPNSLSVGAVDLPTGDHRITLSIADSSGKTASETFRFSVAH